jgi:hypothetical protein
MGPILWVQEQKITHILIVVLDGLHTQVNDLWCFNVKFLNQMTEILNTFLNNPV